jgi:hypothetical protein
MSHEPIPFRQRAGWRGYCSSDDLVKFHERERRREAERLHREAKIVAAALLVIAALVLVARLIGLF